MFKEQANSNIVFQYWDKKYEFQCLIDIGTLFGSFFVFTIFKLFSCKFQPTFYLTNINSFEPQLQYFYFFAFIISQWFAILLFRLIETH